MKESSLRQRNNRAAKRREITIICVLVILLIAAIGIMTLSLKKELSEKQSALEEINEQIAQEQARAEELEEEELLMDSNEFFEKIARERLGLVYPDETIIRPADE